MPIKKDKRHHDFEWEFEPENPNQQPVSVPLRYHYTDTYGPTLSMLDENSNVGYSFPAEMFLDVSEEIRRIENSHTTSSQPTMPNPVIRMPIITSNKEKLKNPSEAELTIDTEDIEEPINGFESFSAQPTKAAAPPKTERSVIKVQVAADPEIVEQRGRTPEEWAKKREEGAKKASRKKIRRPSTSEDAD